MLVKREIIITGDNLEDVLGNIKEKAIECGYQANDHYNQDFHCVIIKPKEHDDFSVDHEKAVHQLRVWPGPPGDREDTQAWNEMLSGFFKQVIEPVCAGTSVDTYLSHDQKEIEDFFSKDLVDLLRIVVEAGPNTSTRWRTWASFLVKAKLESDCKNSHQLYSWLEDEGVEEDSLLKMVSDFELADWILDEYFRQFPKHRPVNRHPEVD